MTATDTTPAQKCDSAAANRAFHTTGSHYINGDTTAFVQFLMSDLFKDFPTLKFIIPHGGGAIPYHWGRYRGIAQDQNRPPLPESVLTKVIPAENILFASEMLGAVKGVDPESGFNYDDTRRYIDASTILTPDQKRAIFAGNARRVYSCLPAEALN